MMYCWLNECPIISKAYREISKLRVNLLLSVTLLCADSEMQSALEKKPDVARPFLHAFFRTYFFARPFDLLVVVVG